MVDTQQRFEEDEKKRPGEYDTDSQDQNPLAQTRPEDVVSGAEDILRQENEARNGQKDGGKTTPQSSLATAEGLGAGALGGDVASKLGKGFTSDANPLGRIETLKNFFWGSRRRKAVSIGGGVTGIAVTGGFLALTFGSGPFEFIHIAELLEQFHFASQEDQSDNRFTSLIRDARYHVKGEPYKTNLNYIGNKLADSFEATLNTEGLSSSYGKTFGSKLGYIVDTENENWQENGKPMTTDEIQAKIQSDSGITVSVSTVPVEGGGTSILIDQPNSYFDAKGLVKYVLGDAGENKVVSAVGARIIGKRDGLTLHPLRKLDSKLRTALDKKIEAYTAAKNQEISTGEPPPEGTPVSDPQDEKGSTTTQNNTTAASADTTSGDAGGDLSTAAAAGEAAQTGNVGPISKLTDSLGSSLAGKSIGGAAVVVGAACLLRGLASDAGTIKEEQVVLPLARMGMRAISEGNQIMAGSSDIDLAQLNADSQQLYDSTSKTSWSQANSIQGELGQTQTDNGGIGADGAPDNGKPDSTLTTIGSGTPFDFLLHGNINSALSPVCSAPGEVVTTVVSFLGGPFSAAASFIVSYVASQTILPSLFSDAAHWLAGDAVNINAAGANFGNDINFGSRLAANDQAVSEGGRALSPSEELALNTSNASDAQSQFDHESLAYKIFSPDSDKSIMGSIIDHQSPILATNLNKAVFSFMDIGHTLASLPSMFLSGIVKAAPSQPYNYGFSAIGFSEAEMDNPAVSNPYANGDAVADILNSSSGPGYITRAQQCFGDTLMQTTVSESDGTQDQVWDVQYGTTPVNVFDSNYPTSACNDSSTAWLQIRFFIFDTQTLKADACYQGDDQSCSDLDFDESDDSSDDTSTNTPTGTTTPTTSGSLPTGTAQQLAQQILNNPKIGYQYDAKEDVQDAANGQPGTAGHPISTTLLAMIVELAGNNTFSISALESHGEGHAANPLDPHYQGDAVDIVDVDGDPSASSGIGRTAGDITIIKEIAPLMPKSIPGGTTSGFGQSQCGTTPPLPVGIVTFEDTCSHLHIQVPLGTP